MPVSVPARDRRHVLVESAKGADADVRRRRREVTRLRETLPPSLDSMNLGFDELDLVCRLPYLTADGQAHALRLADHLAVQLDRRSWPGAIRQHAHRHELLGMLHERSGRPHNALASFDRSLRDHDGFPASAACFELIGVPIP